MALKISIKENEMDRDMVDIFTVNQKGWTTLWAVSNFDLLYDDQDILDRIREGKTIEFELREVK